jgi:hypothetical protein
MKINENGESMANEDYLDRSSMGYQNMNPSERVMRSPDIYLQNYNFLLKRIKNNFHVIVNYSPTG